jgi:hypothetical protein
MIQFIYLLAAGGLWLLPGLFLLGLAFWAGRPVHLESLGVAIFSLLLAAFLFRRRHDR